MSTKAASQPLLKWAGSKRRQATQIVDAMLETCPVPELYVEPFAGSLAVFLELKARLGDKMPPALLADANHRLIHFYQAVHDAPDAVHEALDAFKWDDKWRLTYTKNRDRFNLIAPKPGPLEIAALFVWLNKACYNGLYRENKAGAFNTPAGKYKALKRPSLGALRALSEALLGAELVCADFEEVLAGPYAGTGPLDNTLIYADPPYLGTFSGYSKGGFDDRHPALARALRALAMRGGHVFVSGNPAMGTLYELISAQHWLVEDRDSVGAKGKQRGKRLDHLWALRAPKKRIWDRVDVAALKERIGDARVVVSLSGGKDSTAACLFLDHLGIPYEAVHADTGWEDAETDRYVHEVLPSIISGQITVVEANGTEVELDDRLLQVAEHLESIMGRDRPSAMIRATLHKGAFSAKRSRWCTGVLKVDPFKKWLKDQEDEIINLVGIRREEGSTYNDRADALEWEFNDSYDAWVWRPLVEWLEADVIDIHLEKDCPPNPLYTAGAKRVGCWPCIFARKAEVRMIAERSPERIEVVRQLERAVTWLAAERYARDGTSLEEKGYGRPAFFESPIWRKENRGHLKAVEAEGLEGDEAKATAKARTRAMIPIDEVVAWSKTTRKGEIEPFAPLPHETGCMRWGFCDASWRSNVGAVIEAPEGPLERTMYLKTITGYVKGQLDVELGPLTLIHGDNESGKTRRLNAAELLLLGGASDVEGREWTGDDPRLLSLAAQGQDLRVSGDMAPSNSNLQFVKERNKSGGGKRAKHFNPYAVVSPYRELSNALKGIAQSARDYLVPFMAADVTEQAVLAHLPAIHHDLFSVVSKGAPTSSTPIEKLQYVGQQAAKAAREKKSEVKGAEEVANSIAPQGAAVGEEELDHLREAANTARAMFHNAHSAWQERERWRVRVEQLQADLAAMPTSMTMVSEEQRTTIRALLHLGQVHVDKGVGNCALCATAVGNDHLKQRAQLLEGQLGPRLGVQGGSGRTRLEAELARLQTAEPRHVEGDLQALQNQAEVATRDYEQVRDRAQQWKTWQDARNKAASMAAEIAALEALKKEARKAVAAITDAMTAGFEKRVNAYLPKHLQVGFQLRDGTREVFAFGVRREEAGVPVIHTAISGSTRAALLTAMCLAIGETLDAELVLVVPEERDFDAKNLRRVMVAMGKAVAKRPEGAPAVQVILCSTSKPRGKSVDGWTLIDAAVTAPVEVELPPEKEATDEVPDNGVDTVVL